MIHRSRPHHDSMPHARSGRGAAGALAQVAPGKRTLTMGLAPRASAGAAPLQRKAQSQRASPAPIECGPVEDWMQVALRPDLHQTPILRKSVGEVGYAGAEPQPVPASGAGKPMPAPVQAKMEQSFGTDFSAVRIHEGPQAGAVGALAYAQGTDIHFAPGQYDPGSERGQQLLGHELAHVVQQAQGRVRGQTQLAGVAVDDSSALEREADAMGARAAAAEPVNADTPAALGSASAGPVQRMIDSAVPRIGTPIEESLRQVGQLQKILVQYMFGQVVNNRGQTFEDAVEEFILLYPNHAIAAQWASARHDVLAEPRHDALHAAAQVLDGIRTQINAHESLVPSHPNKRGITPDQEASGTVPQSDTSRAAASQLRSDILQDLTLPGDYNERDDGRWSEQFMLGVLVLPSGQILVAHSGFMGPRQQDEFERIVTARGHLPVAHGEDSYHALQQTYEKILRADIKQHANHRIHVENKPHHDLYKAESTATGEIGNPAGVCAAPQAIDGVSSELLQGTTPLALTELWVSGNPRSDVPIFDAHDQEQRYRGNEDVPSCLTCQIQLPGVLDDLRERQRAIDIDASIASAEGDRVDLAQVQALLDLLPSAHRPGKAKNAKQRQQRDQARARQKLEQARDAYQSARATLATANLDNPGYYESWESLTTIPAISGAEAELEQAITSLLKTIKHAQNTLPQPEIIEVIEVIESPEVIEPRATVEDEDVIDTRAEDMVTTSSEQSEAAQRGNQVVNRPSSARSETVAPARTQAPSKRANKSSSGKQQSSGRHGKARTNARSNKVARAKGGQQAPASTLAGQGPMIALLLAAMCVVLYLAFGLS